MARIEKTVFISYRRTDVYTALAVYQDLTAKGYDVFFDYTSIPSGDFEQIIVSNIKARAHFILILTPTALDRCNEPNDWLRREIETAIDEKRNIIPLFFKDFKFGTPSVSEQLTGKLGYISRYNGLNVHEDYFHAAMDRLSSHFLNVPIDTVLHPVSTEVRKVVKEEKNAVDQLLSEKWDDLKELFKSAEEKKNTSERDKGQESIVPALTSHISSNFRIYGFGSGILLLVALSMVGINRWLNSENQVIPTMTSQVVANTMSVEPSMTALVKATEAESQTFTPTEEPTLTVVPSPTPDIGSTMISLKDGMVMVYVPAGVFKMGNDKGEVDEQPVHDVYLDSYWLDRTEVTNKMYSACVQDGKCQKPTTDTYYLDPDYENHPVVYVSWYDAVDYCSWAEKRLPTEAEWEKAANWDAEKQTKSIYPWGDNLNCSFANYYESGQRCMGKTTAVGSYPKGISPYQALDMAGNVREWVNDRYQKDYYDILGSLYSNPIGPSNGDLRVLRGGSWHSYGYDARSTDRYWSLPIESINYIGFRCAMSATP